MKTLTFIAILQVINGQHPVPLNSSCQDIEKFEKSTGNEYFFQKKFPAVISIDKENKKQWMYYCDPKAWSINITEGLMSRSTAEKFYELAYKVAIKNYGLPEIDNKKSFFRDNFMKYFSDISSESLDLIYPSAVWNIDKKHKGSLSIQESHFPNTNNKDMWSVTFSIDTDRQADCGLIEVKPCENL